MKILNFIAVLALLLFGLFLLYDYVNFKEATLMRLDYLITSEAETKQCT